jgi:mono/diheme cytochrome c family protein
MSHENPELISPRTPDPHEAIQPDSPDFRETPDIEPLSDAREHFPLWLYIVCGVALFLAGSSFTGFQTFGRGLLDQGPGGPPPASNTQVVAAPLTPAQLGGKLYGQNCASCHQASGVGQPGSYPPLAGSEWVVGSKERLALILLAGVNGPITVKGATFSTQVMPAQAGNFNDEKLAAIMTYLRSSWGNTAGPVVADEVAAARSKFASQMSAPCTESQLMQVAPHGPDPTDKK